MADKKGLDLDHRIPETLFGLVKNYSPSGQELGAVNWLVKHMHELGFTRAFVDQAGNAIGIMGEGEVQIVLLGHIDTVPGEIPVKTVDTPDGVNLFGRGTVDAKGPLAAFVDAVAGLGTVPGIQWVVIGAIDEERESIGARYIAHEYHPAYAIIGEPSRWDRITLGYKGSAWADVTVQRMMSHPASRNETAPEVAVAVWNRVQAWVEAFNEGRERLFDQVIPTLRGFSSSQGNYSETATLQIGIRLPQDINPPDWYDQLRDIASKASAEFHPTGYSIAAYRADRNSLLVRAFLGGIREAGGKPGFVVKTGTADLNIVAPVWGCPAVAYGPGDSSLDHTPDEHISLAAYNRAVIVLKAVLQRLAA
jgi:LysW-gamma-L-lysine carboxypeptidase